MFSGTFLFLLSFYLSLLIFYSFSANLPSYDTFPMNEIYYYNTAAPLKQVRYLFSLLAFLFYLAKDFFSIQVFNAELLTNVKIALSKPHRFLNWEGEDEIPIHERPDVCIV
jgi:hypothetical protein